MEGRKYATVFQSKICYKKKLDTQNVEECY